LVNGEIGDPIRTVTSRIRFRHVNVNCYLHSHSQQLPKWYVVIICYNISHLLLNVSSLSHFIYILHSYSIYSSLFPSFFPLFSSTPFDRGWEQLEVTCNPKKGDRNNLWNVEGNHNLKCNNSMTIKLQYYYYFST
jgi:dolichyl-phosphate-mannose-protein mannosyltransferase